MYFKCVQCGKELTTGDTVGDGLCMTCRNSAMMKKPEYPKIEKLKDLLAMFIGTISGIIFGSAIIHATISMLMDYNNTKDTPFNKGMTCLFVIVLLISTGWVYNRYKTQCEELDGRIR